MASKTASFAISLLMLCSVSLVAQSSQQQNSASPQNQPQGQAQQPQNLRRGNGPPCWQQAGIEKSVMEQRWTSERETREQVQAVCTNSSLTSQQKNQQVREIRQQARQKMEGLITPEQEKALTACQEERGMNHPGGAGRQWAGGGCGEWSNGGAHPGAAPNGNGNGANGNPPPNSPPQN